MSTYISEEFRRLVAVRADYLCEYCLIHEDDTFLGCELDHIISVKHNGPTELDNLAYACFFCNRRKGSDIGSILWGVDEFIRFFNPRTDLWPQHFQLEGPIIKPLTDIGTVTVQILGFNTTERIFERQTLIHVGRYPTLPALARIRK
jgi:hypothetical protein